MADKKSGLPSFWASKVAGLLIGDIACPAKVWIPAHLKIEKLPREGGDLVKWKAEHTELLNTVSERLKSQGWSVKLEGQNFFRLRGSTAEIAGKPDIIARKGNAIKVVDAKSGAVRDDHVAQVAIYCIVIPMAWGKPDLRIDGEVAYSTHSVPVTFEQAFDQRGRLFALLRKLGEETRPTAVPSEGDCKFCDVSKVDCPDRWMPGEGDAGSRFMDTSEF